MPEWLALNMQRRLVACLGQSINQSSCWGRKEGESGKSTLQGKEPSNELIKPKRKLKKIKQNTGAHLRGNVSDQKKVVFSAVLMFPKGLRAKWSPLVMGERRSYFGYFRIFILPLAHVVLNKLKKNIPQVSSLYLNFNLCRTAM